MSAWAGEPNHFADRFAREGGGRRDFAERRLFGRYVGEILDEAVASGRTRTVPKAATGARREGGQWLVELADGSAIRADALVLAIGNQEPEPLRAFAAAGARFISNPWAAEARSAVQELAVSGAPALLVGTGLTMIDLVLSLEAAGHRGRIVALSRRGLIPRAHADFDPAPVERGELPQGSVRGLWRWLRRRSAQVGWRAAVDSLRPHTAALWQGLDTAQQQRFLTHARPWWDVHRHRIAPQVSDTLARLVGEDRLEVIAGRVLSARVEGDSLAVDIRRRRAATAETMRFAYAFNCTGPLHAVGHSRDPLLRSLFDSGAVRPDRLGIGLDVDDHSRAAGGERLWALGPLTKGRNWEIIAVPDIREQAAAVADDISRELSA